MIIVKIFFKYLIIVLFSLTLLIGIGYHSEDIFYGCLEGFFYTLDKYTTAEENELREKVEKGEIKIPGRTYEVKLTWGDKYVIYPGYNEHYHIHLVENGEDKGLISDYVSQYEITGDKLFLYMIEGYAVIDKKDNTCKVYLTAKREHVESKRLYNGFSVDDPPIFYAGILEHPLVTYYDFFEDLTKEEQNKIRSELFSLK